MNPRRAFTLFELLLSIALLSGLVFTLLPACLRVLESSSGAEQRSERFAQLSVLSDVIDRLMMTLVAVDERGDPGLSGLSNGIRMVSCGVSLHEDDSGVADDLQRVEIDHAGGRLRIRMGDGAWQVLVERVERVEFSCFDGKSWVAVERLGTVPPAAVSVSVWFGDGVSQDQADSLAFPANEGDEEAPDWRRVFSALDPVETTASLRGDA